MRAQLYLNTFFLRLYLRVDTKRKVYKSPLTINCYLKVVKTGDVNMAKRGKGKKTVKENKPTEDFDLGLYNKNINEAKELLGQYSTQDNYKKQKLSPNEQAGLPGTLGQIINKYIDSSIFTQEQMNQILNEEGEKAFNKLPNHEELSEAEKQQIIMQEGTKAVADRAYSTLEKHLYGKDGRVQSVILPEFKKSVENSVMPYLTYSILNEKAEELGITLEADKAQDEGLKNYIIVTTSKDKKSDAYKQALEKLVGEYVNDTVKHRNISDKEKKANKYLLNDYYKSAGSVAVEAAVQNYASKNEDKIKKLNAEYADKIIAYKDNKKKLEAVLTYDKSYNDTLEALKQRRG